MFDHVKLSRKELTIDAKHDGRHDLGSSPLGRESIPYTITLPEEGIAIVTYTWVNKDNEAGAAIALFGPGIGADPIQARIPDRKVPETMNFSNWKIDNFSMKQDLNFGQAEIYWHNDDVTIDFTFQGFHPPYAYGSNVLGCPKYCADDRIEQSGTVKGSITLGSKIIYFDTTSHRDHSWGSRDWKAFLNYRWFHGQVGDQIAVHFWHLHALGRTDLYGYVFKDGLMAEVTDLKIDWQGDDQFRHKAVKAIVTDDAGRKTTVKADFFAHYPLIPDPVITLMEGAANVFLDEKKGVGWMEMGWQTDYLNHIIHKNYNS